VNKQRCKPDKEIYEENDKYFAKLLIILLIISSHPKMSKCCLRFLQNHHTKSMKEELFARSRLLINPFVTSGTYTSHLQRVFSSPLG
jgi:hypothetical protein